ncbi:ferroxidase [Salpingoeca rosetta]|uniref:Ferroxidase n=1 Tax=Salpingoeca rosetta (strain ATCC 50818 / BSB-021) TaxID=946362 RepID=F2U209_SALR5|nr:ferroxidase [Salpingoeca rosetta]EGD81661.1 ferroxidase [Salpingoeca rosetta]|eukprot:XP_004996865.1 ferroxidase [Salpingoeca rosetta]
MTMTMGMVRVTTTVVVLAGVLACLTLMARPACGGGVVREYFISADKVLWDYAPSGRDVFMGKDFGSMKHQQQQQHDAAPRQRRDTEHTKHNTTQTQHQQQQHHQQQQQQPQQQQRQGQQESPQHHRHQQQPEQQATRSLSSSEPTFDSTTAPAASTEPTTSTDPASSSPTPTPTTTTATTTTTTTARAEHGHDHHGPMGHMHGASTWMEASSTRIGRRYYKAKYREYTDSTFQSLKPVSAEWQHLGLLGPVIRASVGDTIKVVYRNAVDFPTSIHPHGLRYTKDNEGAPYADNSTAGDAIAPGETYTYTWEVPEQSGPGPMDGSSVAWMYHSHVDEPRETNAGLIGVIIITARDKANADATPADVDRELVAGFFIVDEGLSSYFSLNINEFLHAESDEQLAAIVADDGFQESNHMYTINGRVYGNMPGFRVRVGERVRWYLFSFGNQQDLHTPHWHGNTLVHRGHRVDVLQLLPAYITVADMEPMNPGMWMFQCHVTHHIHGGMYGAYYVEPSAGVAIHHHTSSAGTSRAGTGGRTQHFAPGYNQQLVAADSSRTATLTVVAIVMLALLIVALATLYRRRTFAQGPGRGGGQYKPVNAV